MAALKPCGTPAAYRRHRRRGEEACDACKESVRVQQSASKATQKKSAGEARLKLVEPPTEQAPDPLEVARQDFATVTAALESPMTPGGSIAGLSRRREELVDRIRKLSGADVQEVSVLDQLAQRRKDRLAGAAN